MELESIIEFIENNPLKTIGIGLGLYVGGWLYENVSLSLKRVYHEACYKRQRKKGISAVYPHLCESRDKTLDIQIGLPFKRRP